MTTIPSNPLHDLATLLAMQSRHPRRYTIILERLDHNQRSHYSINSFYSKDLALLLQAMASQLPNILNAGHANTDTLQVTYHSDHPSPSTITIGHTTIGLSAED